MHYGTAQPTSLQKQENDKVLIIMIITNGRQARRNKFNSEGTHGLVACADGPEAHPCRGAGGILSWKILKI